MRKAWLLYNPKAGRFPPEVFTMLALRVLKKNGWQVHVEPTRSAAHLTELARRAGQANLEALFVAGGDGSVGRAVAGLLGSETALAVLPTGTSNVWAREIGLPGLSWTHLSALITSAEQLSTGQIKRVDVGLCNRMPFLLWAGFGLDALAVHELETQRRRWKKHLVVPTYALSILRHARHWHGMRLEVHTSEISLHGNYLLALATNIRHYAGGLVKVSPAACLNDGEMDLWLFAGHSLKDVIHHVINLFAGRHLKDTQAQCLPFRQAWLEASTVEPVETDGEPAGTSQRLTLEVLPQALNVLVPKERWTPPSCAPS